MELRLLQSFLAVCEAGTFSRAADELHITQPALSRHIAQLEQELGCPLFERHARSVTPTEQGQYLQRRAEELLALAHQTEEELAQGAGIVAGDIHIGAGETHAMRIVAEHIRAFRTRYPQVRFHIYSGNARALTERLEHGLDDLAVFTGHVDIDRYAHQRLSGDDIWGMLVRADDPLAAQSVARPEDLAGGSYIIPARYLRNGEPAGDLARWWMPRPTELDITATYTLAFNGTELVRAGIGRMFVFDGLVPTSAGADLAFLPLEPALTSSTNIAWKRTHQQSHPVQLFLDELSKPLEPNDLETGSSESINS